MDHADTQGGQGPSKGQNDRDTGEPCAMKVARTVRGGAVRKGLHKQYLACRLLYTRLEGQDADTAIYALSSGAIGQDVDLFGLGRWKEILDLLAPYGISHEGGWRPVPSQRRDWLSRTQKREDAMAARAGAAMEPRRGSLPQGAHVRVIVPESGQARNNKSRKRRGGRR